MKTMTGNLKSEKYEDIDNWLHLLRLIGKKVKKIQIFFTISIFKSVPQLVKNQVEFCDKHQINITTKIINNKYTKHLGFFTGPVLQFAGISNYQQLTEEDTDIEKGLIELKKEIIYK